MTKRTKLLTLSAAIAALYVVLTAVSALFGLDKGAIQLRLSETLCILPIITPAAIPGLAIGCALSSLLFAANILDIIFGSIATLIGAYLTFILRKKSVCVAVIPPILSNTVIIPFVLKYAYGIHGMIPYFAVTVFLGEFICCGIFGVLLLKALPKRLIDSLK
jgi:uncharacterized membrane protein